MQKLYGNLSIAWLEEDNPERGFFRLRPLLVREEGRWTPFDRHKQAFPDDGFLRVVPDKGEVLNFKSRMRSLGCLCALDLRQYPLENTKIRTNKNHMGGGFDKNAYIVYSDVVEPLPQVLMAQVLRAAVTPGGDMRIRMAHPGTRYVVLLNQENITGPYLWAPADDEQGSAIELAQVPECARFLLSVTEMAGSLVSISSPEGEAIQLLINLDALGVKEEAPVSAPAPLSEMESPAPAAAPEGQDAASAIALYRARTKNRSFHDIVDEQWKQSRMDMLGHPVPPEATGSPAATPVEHALSAVELAFLKPDTQSDLLAGLLANQPVRDALIRYLNEIAEVPLDARSTREMEQIEMERLRLLTELEQMRARRESYKQELLAEVCRNHAREVGQIEREMEALRAQKEALLSEKQVLEEAESTARISLSELLGPSISANFMSRTAQIRSAAALSAAVSRGARAPMEPPALRELTPAELIADVRIYFEEAGMAISHDEAVNLLGILRAGKMAALTGPAMSGKSLMMRLFMGALGLYGRGRAAEVLLEAGAARISDWLVGGDIQAPTELCPDACQLLETKDGKTPLILGFHGVDEAALPGALGPLSGIGDAGGALPVTYGTFRVNAPEQLRIWMTASRPLPLGLAMRSWHIPVKAPHYLSKLAAMPPVKPMMVGEELLFKTFQTEYMPPALRMLFHQYIERLEGEGLPICATAYREAEAYLCAVSPHMRLSGREMVDYALSQRILPGAIWQLSSAGLAGVRTVCNTMPRCLAQIGSD